MLLNQKENSKRYLESYFLRGMFNERILLFWRESRVDFQWSTLTRSFGDIGQQVYPFSWTLQDFSTHFNLTNFEIHYRLFLQMSIGNGMTFTQVNSEIVVLVDFSERIMSPYISIKRVERVK